MSNWVKPMNFAGSFYPESKGSLDRTLDRFEEEVSADLPKASGMVLGVVSPHAGYVYSGAVAAQAFLHVRDLEPDTVVILGLAHRAPLSGVSILEASACATPLGELEYDKEFGARLAQKVPFAEYQERAHLSEHSVETQFPFVKRYLPSVKVVEILTRDDRLLVTEILGKSIADTARELGRKTLVVSSTDLSHYPSMEVADEVDHRSLDALLTLDPGLAAKKIAGIESERRPGVSCAVCSTASVFAGMSAAIHLGATQATLLGYRNSGMTPPGDANQVVGYGAVAWSRPL